MFSFWCYSFEHYNGLLESFKKSWHAPEIQIMQKFSLMQTLNATDTSSLPLQFASCLDTIRQNYVYIIIMLDDGSNIFDSKALFLYEKNLFLPPNEVCALKLPCHKIVLPLRENFFTEGTKAHLYIRILNYILLNKLHTYQCYTKNLIKLIFSNKFILH